MTPRPAGPGHAARPAAELPARPARPAAERPTGPVQRPMGPAGWQPRPAPPPVAPRPVASAAAGAPRPTGPVQRPMGPAGWQPRPAGPTGGPRPGGPAGGRPGFGGPRAGGAGGGFGGPRRGGLVIPKVDPKVAAPAAGETTRKPIGQGGDRRKGDAFTRREQMASRPSEEKLFGRRGGMGLRGGVVERRQLKPISIEGPQTVKELAAAMGVTAAEVIKKLLTELGVIANINQELDTDTQVLIGAAFGVEVSVKEMPVFDTYDSIEDPAEPAELRKPRPPVVVVMGHVDHGKTSLLDAFRETKVAAGEAGGITQHIGAYTVELNNKKITFLDTPGHEAFTAMRARGAKGADVAILVVAADDGVMPQTVEAINHAKAANVPIVVAVNKIDKGNANPDRVKQDLTQYGLVVEEWGGETIAVPVSAKQRTNLDKLLEMVLLVAEVADIRANPDKAAAGIVLEAELDKGRGPVATVLVQAGTLVNGDGFVAGTAWGKVRAMLDDKGKKLKKAGPSQPVQIIGFNSVPAAGDIFRVVPDEKTAREVADRRATAQRLEQQSTTTRVSLEDLMSRVQAGEIKDLNLLIKADVQGSVEAVRGQLEKLENSEVKVKVIHGAVGAITESDVNLASTSKAIIIGFNVRPDTNAQRAAANQGVDIRLYRVIYDAVDDIKAAMAGMLKPKIQEVILGRAEVRQTFKVPKVGIAAGCMVLDGKIVRTAKVRLLRDNAVIWEGAVGALKRFKDEAREVEKGFECGITLDGYQDFKEGDIIEAFTMQEIKSTEA